MRSVAWVISRIFDPVLVVPVIIAGVVGLAFVAGAHWRLMVTLLVLDALIPGVYVIGRFVRNKGKDWDIRTRQDRIPLFVLTIGAHLTGVLYVFWLGVQPLGYMLLSLWFLAVLYAGVTMFWKISIHAGVNATLATLVVYFFGWNVWWIWLVPLVVGWARVKEKHHSLSQVLLGSIVPPIVLTFLFGYFGLWG